VSVVVPAYNTARYIGQTLDSVFAQTYRDHEVVVVNDGSPDTPDLETALAPYRSRIRYIARANGGLAAARNTAIRSTTAELIAFLDSDDVWERDYLEVQVGLLDRHPDLAVAYGDAVLMGGPLSGRRFMEIYPSEGPVTFESLVARRCNVMVSVVARREALVRAGLFDESLRRCEDLELWGRMLRAGARIGYHRHPVVRYRVRADSLTSDSLAMAAAVTAVYERFRRLSGLTEAERAAIGAGLRRYRAEVLFFEGKRAFVAGDFAAAGSRLLEANRVFRQRRLGVILRVLEICPRLLRWAYLCRWGASKWPPIPPRWRAAARGAPAQPGRPSERESFTGSRGEMERARRTPVP
jgi:glycosyltransferase involved in cell wall biosynthesis